MAPAGVATTHEGSSHRRARHGAGRGTRRISVALAVKPCDMLHAHGTDRVVLLALRHERELMRQLASGLFTLRS